MIKKTTRWLNLIFCNKFGTSSDPQKGYASTLTDFIELSRDESLPVMDGSVEIDPNISLVVEQLWGTVGEVMSYTSRLIEPLLNTVGFTAEEQSPFCHIFSSPTTALQPKIYLDLFQQSNTNDEACDAPTALPEGVALE